MEPGRIPTGFLGLRARPGAGGGLIISAYSPALALPGLRPLKLGALRADARTTQFSLLKMAQSLSSRMKLRRRASQATGERVHESDRAEIYDLVEAARAGDRASFGTLFDLLHPVVYRTLLARVGSVEDAEDLVAETFVAAWKGLASFEWRGAPFTAWVLTLAHARAASHYRKAAARPQSAGQSEAILERVEAGSDEHHELEQRLEVQRLLHTLSEEQRTVLTLRFYGGRSAEEIGEVIGKSAGAVRVIQLKALERLSMHLRREEAA